jgi:hypothetical protein
MPEAVSREQTGVMSSPMHDGNRRCMREYQVAGQGTLLDVGLNVDDPETLGIIY